MSVLNPKIIACLLRRAKTARRAARITLTHLRATSIFDCFTDTTFTNLSGADYTPLPMPDNYLASYLPLLIQFLLVAAIAGGMVTLSWLLGEHKNTAAKLMPYECGMAPVGDDRQRFSVEFYHISMLVILFDVKGNLLHSL